MRGEDEVVCGFFVIASEAKQSILSLRGAMDCFASLAMTARQDGLLRCARNDGLSMKRMI